MLLVVCPEWVFVSMPGFFERRWSGGVGETRGVTLQYDP